MKSRMTAQKSNIKRTSTMMKRLFPTALAVLLLLLAGCTAKPDTSNQSKPAEYYLTDTDLPLDDAAQLRAAPDFLTAEQQTVSSTQCGPCYSYAPTGRMQEYRAAILSLNSEDVISYTVPLKINGFCGMVSITCVDSACDILRNSFPS